MKAKERRQAILADLKEQSHPITASQLAQRYQVSRQVIVGDIALLRASNIAITASNQGYFLTSHLINTSYYTGKIVCQHGLDQTATELQAIIDLGARLIDVEVDHPIYGLLLAPLPIEKQADIDYFMESIKQDPSRLLSSLTEGLHSHTIQCRDFEHFRQVQDRLKELGILYQD
ncbi:DNA-binding protein [Facklamia sp. HMSC062C11]|uniref:Transcription repressor NadR n=1 Tax=Facklamia hominis TaxID=178214 RepID=A0AAJ1V5X0_9LACT|nr:MULTISPECIES: transcription repressor NadR [Facklamia]EPH12616.1 hypothetical protein HMPREF9260_00540 [Facklamia hominis ACS-120-V-Sch10]MDK7187609.1 transcription repressor NadR [Facklamia hominis]OFL64622.1 DNA-binding protein [Facklamia sp. HMSC062C11]